MTSNKPRVLVTGASGFIGRHLLDMLANQGFQVVALRRRQQFCNLGQTIPDKNNHIGDINDRELLERAMEGVQFVFHLAGIVHVNNPDSPSLQSINVDGTASIIKAAQSKGVSKIIFFSSSLAGDAEVDPNTATDYSKSKLAAENLLMQASHSTAQSVCILRPVNVYGPGMKGNLDNLIRLIRKRLLPPLPNVHSQFSLIGIHDLCRAAIIAAESDKSANRVYWVSDGIDYHLNEIERAIYTALGRVKPRWHCPRVILYAAALVAEATNWIRGGKSSLGLRTYRNLTTGKVHSSQAICEELGFTATETFYDKLPEIIAARQETRDKKHA